MPYCCLTTNVAMNPQGTTELAEKLSRFLEDILGKPEKWIMVQMETGKNLLFGGSNCPAAYCELKSIGLPLERCTEMSKALCEFLWKEARIEQDRVYINFTDLKRAYFGWNGKTFGTM